MPHRNFRQDRHAHVRRAKLTEQLIAPALRNGGADPGGEPGALLQAPAGPRHPRGGERGASTPGGHRSQRTARPGSARDRFRPSIADHQPRASSSRKSSLASISFRQSAGGLECVVAIDDRMRRPCAFAMRRARRAAHSCKHLGPKHQFAAGDDRLGRSRVGGALPGRASGHHRDLRRRRVPKRSSPSSGRKPPPPRRSTSATASTTPRR